MRITAVRLHEITGEVEDRGQIRPMNAGRLGRALDVYPKYKAEGPGPAWEEGSRPGYYRRRDKLLEIETDEGLTGTMTKIMGADHIPSLAPHLLGENPMATERIWDILYRASLSAGFGDVMSAIAAIDIALWDIKCQALNTPLCTLLGGPVRQRVPAYAMARDFSKEPEEVRRVSRELVDQGFRAIKWYPSHGPSHGREGQRKNIEFVAACREAVGPDVEIMLDCWKTWDAPYTVEMARRLEPYRIKWIEEPVFQYQFAEYAEIRRQVSSTLISGGEQLYALWQFRHLLADGCVDIVQPDPIWCGGITQIQRIIALARAYETPVVMHVCHVPLNIHLSAALPPTVCPLIEYPAYHRQIADQFFLKNKVYAVDGEVPVPTSAPIYELDESVIVEKREVGSWVA
jgi:L-alanine-DL-glutamate epimerase-like enolase superfamily enzyme